MFNIYYTEVAGHLDNLSPKNGCIVTQEVNCGQVLPRIAFFHIVFLIKRLSGIIKQHSYNLDCIIKKDAKS